MPITPQESVNDNRLDKAIFAAYGWKNAVYDEEILERLLSLNLERGK